MAPKFLIVDDSPAIRIVLKSGLTREGVLPDHILEASSGSQALSTFKRERPEVVFMDLTLEEGRSPAARKSRPSEGGEEVAKRMLQDEPRTKIVVCTGASGDDPRVRELVRFGAFYVMLKPIQIGHIRAFLQMLAMEMTGDSRLSP